MKPAIFSVPARVSRLLARWSALFLTAAVVQADPIPVTTIGFGTVSGAINDYYNGGTDAAGNSGPNVGIVANTANTAGGGVLNGLINPIFSVPSGFTGGFSVEAINVAVGFAINVYDGENGTGTLLASQGFTLNGNTPAAVSFAGTAKSVLLARWSGNPSYDNFTFGSTTIGTPVSEPPAVTTGAATGVTSATATLNATINPAGTATTAQFEYGTTPSYGSTASVTLSPNDGTTDQTVSANLSGLAASTTYYYRATAANGVGTRNGAELTFTTAAPPATALHFDGSNDQISVPHSAALALTTPFTVETWIKPEATAEPFPTIFSKNGDHLVMWLDGTRIDARIGGVQLTGPTITFGVWTHVALTYDGVTGRIYKNGVLAASGGVVAPTANSNPFYLGYWQVYGRPFRGAMDEFRVWTVARTAQELLDFKDSELATMPASLVLYFKLNQGVSGGNNTGVTTALNETGGPNGTLNNFGLSGTTGNWINGSGIVETASALSGPDINLKGGSPLVTIPDGTTATGTANDTDLGSALVGTGTAKTFTLENIGNSTLMVSDISFGGANPDDYSVSGITLPATVAPSSSTTFTVTFTPLAEGARTATVNVISDDSDESIYDFALTGTGTLPPATALHFDGVDDKVTIPHRAELNSLPVTVECWFKPTASGSGVSSIVNKYVASSGNGWAIHYAGGQVSGWYYALPGYVNTTLPGVSVSLNTWHHVAMVVETTGSKLYVDGVLASSAGWSGVPTMATTTQDVTLGEYVGNAIGGKFFPGAVDEVRIWNGARSLAEIQAFKDTEIASMPSCLMAYYKFSEGSADGVNTGVTALPDIANAFADNGTLANFALSGTTGNWTTGPALTAAISTYAATPDINLVGNGNQILDGTTATATGNNTDFGASLVGAGVPKTFTLENTGTSDLTVSTISFSGANPGDYAVSGITLPATVGASGSTTFTVTFTPAAAGARTATVNVVNDDCDESNYDFALTGSGTQPPATALHFDGVNDSVDIPHQLGQLGYPFTVEAWVKTTDTHGLLVSKYVASSGNGWQMGTEGGKLTAWFFRPGGAGAIFPSGSGLVGATTINNGAWHHVAFVVDSTGGRLYVDGVSDGFSGWTWGTPGPATTTAPVRLGDVTVQAVYPFAGTLDEVRIWSVARSAAELLANKDTELAVMPPCLVGYYKLNYGTVGANNAGVTSAVDETGGASGTLNNFALSGLTSNWTDGSGITSETSVPDPTAPEINLTGNTLDIPLADTTPRPEDDTDFGNATVLGSPVVRTFTVQNTGPGASVLNVSGISVTGTHAADFVAGPLDPIDPIAGGGSATFTVTFSPGAVGLRLATVTVNNDDCNESAYSFAVQGTGVNKPPTVAATSPTITVDEGTTAFNGISFSDPEGNPVTLTASLGTVSVGGGASAFAGSDLTTAGQWRTASVVKPSDPDGDNVYGTDGYAMWGLNGVETVANPAYATITRNPSLSFYPGDANYNQVDDPTNPAGPQKLTGVIYNVPGGAVPTEFYTITFTQPRRVRMGILVDNTYVPAVSPTTLRLRQTVGGTYDSGHVAAGDGSSRNETTDYYFFDIAAQAGDVFEISGINDVGFLSNGIGGMFLDTAGWSYAALDGPAGPTTVTITATDSLGASGQTTFTLNVNNVAPTIALTGDPTVANGTPYTLNLGAITDPGTDTVSAFSINWGDGNTENFTGNPASTTKTHTYTSVGAKTITVNLTDEDGTFTGGSQSVTVENAAPVAAEDGLNRPNTTTVAKVLKATLLANDTDADSDPLTLTAVGNALPASATVTITGNFVVYTAPGNNAGNGSFTYTLSDGTHTVTGTVTVTETSTSGGGGGTPNYLTLVQSGDDFVVTFLGVPGGSFRVQYSTAGPTNYDWQEFASPAIYTAAPNGVFTHTDVNPPGPVRFYRAVSNP